MTIDIRIRDHCYPAPFKLSPNQVIIPMDDHGECYPDPGNHPRLPNGRPLITKLHSPMKVKQGEHIEAISFTLLVLEVLENEYRIECLDDGLPARNLRFDEVYKNYYGMWVTDADID